VTESSGASVIVPAGAFATGTTIRIAQDSTGAPAVPEDLTQRGSIYMITPHGGEFAEAVEVRLPVPNVTLTPFQEFKIAKAQPGEPWVVLEDTALNQGSLSAKVDSFSFFMVVVITYPIEIAQAEPMRMSTSITCTDNRCSGLIGSTTATFTVTTNNGQTPGNCANPIYGIGTAGGSNISWPSIGSSIGVAPIAPTGGSLTRALNPGSALSFKFGVGRKCGVNGRYSDFGQSNYKYVYWAQSYGPTLSIVRMPEQVDVVEGLVANVDVVMAGGAAQPADPGSSSNTQYSVPTRTNRAIIDWERSDDGGASWRVVARSYQDEANSLPAGVGYPWRYWGIRHGFVATATDQGALLRLHACYASPTPTDALPCVDSAISRINVLQQSALPTIVDSPRSMLIRTGQTANFSATASGLPAPTLQWQWRPANSSGAWSDVTTGTGATTANYTTAALAPSDNGTQYRVVATNAVGSAQSSAVSVSVSDLDVAPTITTQPGSLNVTSGSDAIFAVDARGTEALSYQWFANGVAIAGANGTLLRISGATSANAGSYSVTVSNGAGSATSNPAVLTVSPGAPAAVVPSIVTQPASVTANLGSTATLAVGVDGTGPFSFQWRRDGVNITGATSAVLTFNSVALPNAGTFSVVVTNSAGSATSGNAVLDVTAVATPTAPSITSQPATLIVPYRGAGVVAVGATGSGPLSYQWSKDGEVLPGATLPVMDFALVVEQDVGTYTVTVSNSMGSVVSRAVDVILLGAPVITLQPEDVTVLEGENTYFYVQASSSGLRYQWLMNGNPIPGRIGNTLVVESVVAANSGAVYSVMVYNGAGHVFSQGAVLTVQTLVAPTITQHPQDVTIEPGAQAEMCVTIGGTPTFDVQLQRWNGSAWAPGIDVLVNNNTQVCYFTSPLTLADNGAQYRFLIDNPAGEVASNTATVTVQAPSGITTTTLASRATSGASANNRSGLPSLSSDGNIVAFISDGTNLVPNFGGYPLASSNGYVRNISAGTTTLVNVTPAGTQSQSPYGVIGLKLAAGGRHVIFSSLADDLVADDTNGSQDVFVRDLQTGITTRVSQRADGTEVDFYGNAQSDMQVDISGDGRFVSFVSSQALIGDEEPGAYSLYFRSLQTGFLRRVFSSTTTLVSYAALSDNGEHMAYLYGTFVPGQTRNIIVHYDTEANSSQEVFSIDTTNNVSFVAQGIGISGNGRYLAFSLRSPPMFGSNFTQVMAIDLVLGEQAVASGNSNGFGNGHSNWPKVSDDGHIAFQTTAGNLTGDFTNSQVAVLAVRDFQGSALDVASRRPNGTSIAVPYAYAYHAISSDGRVVAFAADEFDMSGGMREHQVYVAPRP
jgi:hypothetical protein